MSYKKYFSYVRVSSQRQGQTGTSLSEQLSAIENYARRFNLDLVDRYEERETAAKTGRPVFSDMLRALKQNKAQGIIIHKIDRSARNLKDWAELGTLIDLGVEVHFANESLDLNSRGGRLSADIQAVVAADFIRNLREESKKGIYGRLKQGLYPFPSRVGYLDAGKGKPKTVDPFQGPLVASAFELYAKGNIGLDALVERMYALGLRNKNGRKVTRNGLVCILRNPFYFGVIRMNATTEIYQGRHQPLISKELFDTVQNVFAGKNAKKHTKHFFVFRKYAVCNTCKYNLIPEWQKGHIYYRCQSKICPQKTVREELLEDELLRTYKKLSFGERETKLFKQIIAEYKKSQPEKIESIKHGLVMKLEQIEQRLSKLADAYVDGVFDKETYNRKKNQAVLEQSQIRRQLNRVSEDPNDQIKQVEEFLELANRAYLSYELGMKEEKREMVQITTSNFLVQGKSVKVKLKMPFEMIAEREALPVGRARLATSRTLSALLKQLLNFCSESDESHAV